MKIEVCLASFNGADHIREQIDSILYQLPVDGRLMISDDGSTDQTVEIIRSYGDGRIELMMGPGAGVVRNFEFLLENCKGDLVFLADQDDIWRADKVAVVCRALNDADLVASNAIILNSSDSPVDRFHDLFSWRSPKGGILCNIARNGFVGCTMAFRREILSYALPFPKHISMHDQWLALITTVFGTVHVVDEELISYRRHAANVTGLKSSQSIVRRIKQRLLLGSALAGRTTSILARNGTKSRHPKTITRNT